MVTFKSNRWHELWKDTDGAVLPYATAMLVVLVGGALLSIDGARYMGLQSQLQKAADAAAIAAAAELDRKPTAIARAQLAIDNLVSNRQTFGEGPAKVEVRVRYLASLPASDNTTSIPASYEAKDKDGKDDPHTARFVEVTVVPTTLRTVIPATFLGAATNTATTTAVAVAGQDTVACKFTPVYICNPYEGLGDFLTIAKTPSFRKRLIKVTREPADSTGAEKNTNPGNFGYLSAPFGNGSKSLEQMLAAANPGACFVQSGVETQTGSPSVEDALNVRFDLFPSNNAMGFSTGNDYPTAANVRKGYKVVADPNAKDKCGQVPGYDTEQQPPVATKSAYRGFTRDTCFYSGTCSLPGAMASVQGRIGDGQWDFQGYMLSNHSAVDPKFWPAATSSRYQVYQWENTNAARIKNASSGGEVGTPICKKNSSVTTPDRRLLYGAVINCNQYADLLKGGSGKNIPVEAFAKFFLTEPAQGDNAGKKVIWAELADVIETGDADGVLHDQVQLYR